MLMVLMNGWYKITILKVMNLGEGELNEVKFHVGFDLFAFLENSKIDFIQYFVFNASDYH